MYILSVQYSCAVVSVFLFGGKANLVRFTLFYSTLLMDGMTDRETIHLLCVGWRNLFSSCAVVLCQFLVLVRKRFWSTYACLCGRLVGALSLATARLCQSRCWLIVVHLLLPSPSSPSLVHHPCHHRSTRRCVTSRHIVGALLLIGIVAGWWDASRNNAIIDHILWYHAMLENSNVFLAPVHSYLKPWYCFYVRLQYQRLRGEKMAPKPETNVGCTIIITTGKKKF